MPSLILRVFRLPIGRVLLWEQADGYGIGRHVGDHGVLILRLRLHQYLVL